MSGRFNSPLRSETGSRVVIKRVPLEDGKGYTLVEDGFEQFSYEVNIDWNHVREMARQAAINKTGQSHDGPVQIKITSRKRV